MKFRMMKIGLMTAGLSLAINSQAASAWASYCSDGTVVQKSHEAPIVNYANSTVKKAATRMSKIEEIEIKGRLADGKFENDGATGEVLKNKKSTLTFRKRELSKLLISES